MLRSSFARRLAARPVAAVMIVGTIMAAATGLWYALLRPDVPNTVPPRNAPRPDPLSPDPREVFATPFRNVKPGVEYVGDAACAGCHADVAKSYRAHPMGRSADWVARAVPVERYDSKAKNPFAARGFEFRVEKVGERVVHRMSATNPGGASLAEYAVAADVAIGSGTRGRTYVTVQDGAVWQSPVSWFAPKGGRWDLSPEHELEQGARRAIVPGCLFCHTHRVEPVPGAENRYRQPLFRGQVSIGCERCHGPGAVHVAERLSGRHADGVDYAIVNPKHLPADLRADVCRQCHLQGAERVVRRGRDPFEYRPGLPWDQFVSTFILRPDVADYQKSVGQFEQMEVSRCFSGSGGNLQCISCHDPHAKPTGQEAVRFFRDRCLTCHESKGCSAPAAERAVEADSCVVCHMPRGDSSNIAHVSVTDHRIPRKPGAAARPTPGPGRPGPAVPLVPYRPGSHAPTEDERDRDWAIATSRVVISVPEAKWLRPLMTEKLASALHRWPGDAEAWIALATLKGAAEDAPGAVEAARFAAELAPGSETALSRLALEARLAGDLNTALPAAEALVRMSPTSVHHRLARAEIHIRRRDWADAEADARAALAIQPLYWKARLYLAVCYHQQGHSARAAEELATATGLIPSERLRAAYLRWFREQTR